MQFRLYLPDFEKQKIYYYNQWRQSFLIQGNKKIEENLPGSQSFSLEDDKGELRLITITKKPSFFAPKGNVSVSTPKNNQVAQAPAVYPYGRLYSPNEILAMLLSIVIWLPGAAIGILLALFVVVKMRPILLSELSFLQKTFRIVLYHIGALVLYLTIAFLLVYVFKIFPVPN